LVNQDFQRNQFDIKIPLYIFFDNLIIPRFEPYGALLDIDLEKVGGLPVLGRLLAK